MPFPDLIAAGFTAGEDSQFFNEDLVDSTIVKEVEGGFRITRPRFTRVQRPVITTGFTEISTLDRQHIINLWNAKRGGSVAFAYVHPVTGETLTVRFKADSPPSFKYVGIGSRQRWTVSSIVLEPV